MRFEQFTTTHTSMYLAREESSLLSPQRRGLDWIIEAVRWLL